MNPVRWLTSVSGFLALVAICAAQSGDDVRARLQAFEVLRGEFSQEKHLQGFRHPLRSDGRFLLARARGVIWETRQPFPSTLVLTAAGLSERDEQGGRHALLDATGNPAVEMLHALLPALIAGDLETLSQSFEVTSARAEPPAWRLQLRPRSGPMHRVFESISLRGEAFVSEVELHERNGDFSVLRFSALQSSMTQLDAEEARRFD